jgi:hypothetical protein
MRVCVKRPLGRHWGVLLLSLAVALGPARAMADFEYWPKAIVRVALNEQWQFGAEQWVSLTDNGSRFKDTQTDLYVIYDGLADWLSVSLGYKRIFEKAEGGWEFENRPLLNLAIKAKVRGFGIVDRSRFEYRMPEDETESWRYRHKLVVTSPVTFTPLKIQPYTADEVFYSFDGSGFNQHRLYGGCFLPLHEKVRLELFYIWRLEKEDDGWQAGNVLGSWIYFLF